MMKGLPIQRQNSGVEENMSHLTSTSAEFSASSANIPETPTIYPHQYAAPPPSTQTQPLVKKKRNLPGNPDPDAEVIALSPKTLMATNRFVCEICKKGFQRDQNLQLHRRGHNLPWKLKQRESKEVIRKKVYVCPETSCVHHDPSRALGDLTGIKKHFSRKHGEKKWKCEKCSKKYAVQSDWKAHSKTCGAREYRCDCGTIFSRRDSFITHRAFCDALTKETARGITSTPFLSSSELPTSPSPTSQSHINNNNNNNNLLQPQLHSHDLHSFPWLDQDQELARILHDDENPNPNPNLGPTFLLKPYHQTLSSSSSPSPHMSATALLQKAAQIGATMSATTTTTTNACSPSPFGNLSPAATAGAGAPSSSLFQEMMASLSSASGFVGYKGGSGSGGGGDNEGTTRDFLGWA